MSRCNALIGATILGTAFLVGTGTSQEKKADETPAKIKAYLPPGWKSLGLTKEQSFEISKIHDKHKGKIKALDDQIKEAKAQEKQEMVKLLTPEQKDKLLKLVTGDDAPKKTTEEKK